MQVNKELKTITISFLVMVVGFILAEMGFESLGRFLAATGILNGIIFIAIGNIKYWLVKKPPDHLGNKSDQNNE